MEEESMGLGIKQLSTAIQEAKLAIYYRAIFSRSNRRNFTFSSMIARVLRESDSQPIRGGSFTTKKKLQIRTSWWATRMVQYLQSINKSSTRQTIHFNNANQFISHQLFKHDNSRQNLLHSLGIMTYGELVMDCDNDDDQTTSLGLAWAAPHLVCNTPLVIRVGQAWEVQADIASSVYEIA